MKLKFGPSMEICISIFLLDIALISVFLSKFIMIPRKISNIESLIVLIIFGSILICFTSLITASTYIEHDRLYYRLFGITMRQIDITKIRIIKVNYLSIILDVHDKTSKTVVIPDVRKRSAFLDELRRINPNILV